VVVWLDDAASARDARDGGDDRRRVVLAERLADLEATTDAIAKLAVELVSGSVPAMLEALEAVLTRPGAGDGGLLERLVRADPERARRALDQMTGATGPGKDSR
jgi:hypothetical protein